MLNYNDNDETLMEFYNVATLNPQKPSDLDAVFLRLRDADALNLLSHDEQLDILNQFLHKNNGQAQDHKNTDEDHKDPLGGGNLVETLLRKGTIGSENDDELNQYLVSSQRFNSKSYLSVVHQNTPIEQLVASLDALDHNIRDQTSELKSVLDENYEHFVKCKKAIDEILVTFKGLKSRAQQDSEKSKVFNPAARKNKRDLQTGKSLSAELEVSINNLNVSSSLMIRPIMEHNAKEAKVMTLIEFIQKNKFFFDLPNRLVKCLLHHDHDQFIDDYNKYLKEREHFEQRHRQALEKAQLSGDDDKVRSVEQEHLLRHTALSRVFVEVENIAGEYRKKAFRELLSMDHEVRLGGRNSLDAKFIELVDKLHRLNVDEKSNPIFEFLSAQLNKIKKDLQYQNDKFETKFTVMQKKLLDYITSLADQREGGSYVRYIGEKFESVEEYFRTPSLARSTAIDKDKEKVIMDVFESSENLDLSIINEAWLVLSNYIKYLEEFFQHFISKFVNNYTHYSRPDGGFDVDPEGALRDAFFILANDVVSRLVSLFDIDAPIDQMKVSPSNYSFLPPHTNSLSAIFYLTDISRRVGILLTVIGQYVGQIGNTTKSIDTNKQVKSLREASSIIDQRILEAICATWVNDCSQFYDLENWERYNAASSSKARATIYTKLMQILRYYEWYVLSKLAKFVFDKSAIPSDEIRVVAAYPSKRVLVSLEIQFMRSMNVLMDSIMKTFTREKNQISEANGYYDHDIEKDIYKILAMNNFTVLGESIFPSLIGKFDVLFDKSLQKQNLKLFADLDKVRITIVDEINDYEKLWIESKIDHHFTSIEEREHSEPIHIDSFVYESLMHFVKLIHVMKPLTDLETFVAVIHELQTHFLVKFLLCLRTVSEKEKVIVQILGNLKLDLDFFVEVFEASDSLKLDEYCLNLVQITLGHIDKIEGIFKDLGFTNKELDDKLYRAINDSENEFSCFL